MHGLPKDFDLSVFIGKVFEQICFTENTVSFFFGDNISITVESKYSYGKANKMVVETIPATSSSCMNFLGKTVKGATPKSDGTMNLVFEDDSKLTFVDDSKQYESYRIRIGDTEIII
jgi:hypothetical protein